MSNFKNQAPTIGEDSYSLKELNLLPRNVTPAKAKKRLEKIEAELDKMYAPGAPLMDMHSVGTTRRGKAQQKAAYLAQEKFQIRIYLESQPE